MNGTKFKKGSVSQGTVAVKKIVNRKEGLSTRVHGIMTQMQIDA